MRIYKLLFLSVIFTSVCFADVINIPVDFETIQAGIDASEDADTVLVAPGEYEENLVIHGKEIVLSSLMLLTDDPEYISSTIVDGGRNGSTITLEDFSGVTLIKGLTLCNGLSEFGGGVSCHVEEDRWNVRPHLEDLEIYDNEAERNGGGVYFEGGTLQRVIVRNNRAGENGGGVFGGWPIHIDDSEIRNNTASNAGGGLYLRGCYLRRVLVANNSAGSSGGGIYYYQGRAIFNQISVISNIAGEDSCGGILSDCRNADGDSSALLTNSVVFGNSGHELEAIFSFGQLAVSHSDIEGGFEEIVYDYSPFEWRDGNIDDDPLFVDAENGDYHLTADSPCIDAGDPEAELDPDGTRADMGAFHYHQRDIDVNPLEVQFPPIEWDALDSLSITISNIGRTDLTIDSIAGSLNMGCIWMNEDNPDEWEPLVIEPQGDVELWIYYRPQVGAVRERTFWFFSDDPDEPEVTVHAEGDVIDAVSEGASIPDFFNLVSVYPNPFNASTTITYTLPTTRSNISLSIYNIRGQLVDVLLDRVMPSGRHSMVWDGSKFSTGVYLVRMVDQDRNSKEVRKVVLVK